MSIQTESGRFAISAKALLILAAMLMAAYFGFYMKPTKLLADLLPEIKLESDISTQMGAWKVDTSLPAVLPDPSQQAFINQLYNETTSRTYANTDGYRIMFTAAYGKHQADDTLQLHNPEICYSAQGFNILDLRPTVISVGKSPLKVHQMRAIKQGRPEVVTYWIVIGEENANTRTQQKFVRLHYALGGYLSDGLLMRVSSIDTDSSHAYEMHEQFVNTMFEHLSPELRARYFGQQ